MSDLTVIALANILPGSVTALTLLLRLLLVDRKVVTLAKKVDKYHEEVNGKMTLLLNVTGAAREAEGELKGELAERARVHRRQVKQKRHPDQQQTEGKLKGVAEDKAAEAKERRKQ
jgi:hypothetical protein